MMPLLLALWALLHLWPRLTPPAARRTRKPAVVQLRTLNVLGASHTDAPGGSKNNRRWKKSAERTRILCRVVKARGGDVWAFQEMQPSQRRAVQLAMRLRYAAHWSVDNVVMWDRLRWKVVERGFITTPYFGGHPRRMPYVVLKGRRAGRVIAVLCTHDPASTRGDASKWRRECVERAADWAEDMHREHAPDGIYDMGDKNSHSVYANTAKALGAQLAGIPRIWGNSDKGIDWIVGWPGAFGGLTFRRFRTVTSKRLREATDHPLVMAEVVIP